MSTWSVRCRVNACRHRRVSRKHPIEDDSACPSCGSTKGWRVEQRTYNKVGRCYCAGPIGRDGAQFPHSASHPLCDHHPRGHVNQALARGLAPADLPLELMGVACTSAEAPF